MVNSKEGIVLEMKEQEAILNMYKEAFPENPAFAGAGKKKKKQPVQQQPKEVAQPTQAVEEVA